jgi:hypothetical protein
MRLVTFRLTAAALVFLLIVNLGWAQAPPKPAAEKGEVLPRFPFHEVMAVPLTVEEARPDGSVRATLAGDSRQRSPVALTEGYYLAIAVPQLVQGFESAVFLRVQIAEITDNGAELKVAAEALPHAAKGRSLVLFRPQGLTTKTMSGLPASAAIEPTADPSGLSAKSRTALTRAQYNAKQIAVGMHMFHDAYKHLPPATVIGPDGKPWHSWRVLLLPYVQQGKLYAEYRFDEPWDGPNNRKLWDKVPDIYRDPIYEGARDSLTHFAVPVGRGTAFPPQGAKMKAASKETPFPLDFGDSGPIRFSSFRDGMSNALIVGSVSPDRKITWTKPEDVVFDEKFAAIGDKASFAAPYQVGDGGAGVFARGDGSVLALLAKAPVNDLRLYLTIDDGQVAPTLPTFEASNRPLRMPVFEYVKTPSGIVVRQSNDPAEPPGAPFGRPSPAPGGRRP